VPRQRKYRVPPKLAEARRRGYSAWRKRDEADRRSRPPLPPEPAPGDLVMRWQIDGNGWGHTVEFRWPERRNRCDRFALLVDGVMVSELIGLTDALDLLRTKYIPRQANKMQRWQADLMRYSAWDETETLEMEA
jgi:hypothetical protein